MLYFNCKKLFKKSEELKNEMQYMYFITNRILIVLKLMEK